jgi:tetratricopeptide (TPR) repeat protein
MIRSRMIPIFFLCSCLAGWAQVTSDFSLTVYPNMNIPLGPSLPDGTAFYSLGGGLSLRGDYSLPFARFLYTGVTLDADYVPINSSTASLILLSGGAQLGVQFYPLTRFGVRLAVFGGEYAGILSQGSVLNPFFGGMADLSYLLSPMLSIGLGASCKYAYTPEGAAYYGLSANVGIRYHFGAGTSAGKIMIEPTLQPIYPLFYSYYDKNPAGSLVIKNASTSAITDVKVSFFVKQFMDQPKVSWTGGELAAGESKTLDVYALFKDTIFTVTEATKVAGEISVSYKSFGSDMTASHPVTVTILNRNGITWDDTRKAAAFVTTNDDNLRAFAARAVPDARSRGNPAINKNFRSAMALFDALNVHGLGYLPPPNSSYAEKSAMKTYVDYVQFPVQTLQVRAGDCSDISILYAALLEFTGIRTAFITTPGHIFLAFDLDMDRKTAQASFLKADERLIYREDGVWLPVEITLVKKGFLKAWQTGAQEWRAASSQGTADFVLLHAAWEKYSPANTGEIVKAPITPPDAEKVWASYSAELKELYDADYKPRIDEAKKALSVNKGDAKLLNRLGVLYARFGMYKDAQQQFEAIVKKDPANVSALVNIGNILFLNGKAEESIAYYNRALAIVPTQSAALQGLIMAGYELAKTDLVDESLSRLKSVDPEAVNHLRAQGVTSSAGSARAASADKEMSTWDDE